VGRPRDRESAVVSKGHRRAVRSDRDGSGELNCIACAKRIDGGEDKKLARKVKDFSGLANLATRGLLGKAAILAPLPRVRDGR
jgi:hypothetical protein